jgi:RimJ/RimL family protein N-acetyltransferase
MPAYLLRTARLGLRRYTADDVEALAMVFGDPQAARFYPAMQQRAGQERWITWNLQNYAEHGHGLWAIEQLDSGLFIGDAGITWQTALGQRLLEVGWHIHPDHRGQGYATEAGLACLRHGFEALRAGSLSSIVDPANAPSIRVAQRVHADRREYAGPHGTMLLFGTTAAQYARRCG